MRGFIHRRWNLDEMVVRLSGEMVYLWRAVDHEGEMLESFVTWRSNKAAALTFMKKARKRHESSDAITTDDLRSYGAATADSVIVIARKLAAGSTTGSRTAAYRSDDRNAMFKFLRIKALQMPPIHSTVFNHFTAERHRVDRQTAKNHRYAALAEGPNLAA